MKKVFLSLLLISIFTFCKKEKQAHPLPEVQTTDDIEFKDIEPDLSLTSLNGNAFLLQDASGVYNISLPVDTMAEDSITSDSFSYVQFKVTAYNFKTDMPNTPSSVHLQYGKGIRLSCIHPLDSIIVFKKAAPSAKYFSEGAIVDAGFMYGNPVIIRSEGGSFGDITNASFPAGDHYVGFKTTRTGHAFFGWIKVQSFGANGIKIKEVAINKAANRAIVCGQKN